MEIKEIIAVLQAFENGEEIEWSYKQSKDWYILGSTPMWSFGAYNYRIKPKQKYIPFDYNDDLVGKVIKSNKSDKVVNHPKLMIVRQENLQIKVEDYYPITYKDLLENYIFLDGSKCGKLT
jgi:hypothetical protein